MSEDRQLTYKQRHGFEALPQAMRVGELSDDLRREVWNSIFQFIRSRTNYFDSSRQLFYEYVIGHYKKLPISQIDTRLDAPLGEIENIIMRNSAENALDLIEILMNYELCEEILPYLIDIFEKHTAPYRIDLSIKPFRIFQNTSKEEAEAIVASIQAIKNVGGFDGALTHLRNAAEFINEKKFADSIRHSINAVESVARSIEPGAKTLGSALTKLEREGIIKHPALKTAFVKLYGYTNDEQGIRHALIDRDDPNVGLPEALFFHCACTAFAGYLATIGNIR